MNPVETVVIGSMLLAQVFAAAATGKEMNHFDAKGKPPSRCTVDFQKH